MSQLIKHVAALYLKAKPQVGEKAKPQVGEIEVIRDGGAAR